MNQEQLKCMSKSRRSIVALDQSDDSIPKALKGCGIGEKQYNTDGEMFDLVHEIRTRIITSPSSTSDHIPAAILLENTIKRGIEDRLIADYLWEVKGITPILKVDKGLAEEEDEVRLMKPILTLDVLLIKTKEHHIFGTKMRPVIEKADPAGTKRIVDRQLGIGPKIVAASLVPMPEPEIDIYSPNKAGSECIVKEEIRTRLSELPEGIKLVFEPSIPNKHGFYSDIMRNPHIVQVVALSRDYPREGVSERLSRSPELIASFSRALSEGLSTKQAEREFDHMPTQSIKEIYEASIT